MADQGYRTMGLGRFAGPIFTIILIVDCLWFAFLEWWIPRADLEIVQEEWDVGAFEGMRERWEETRGKGRDDPVSAMRQERETWEE